MLAAAALQPPADIDVVAGAQKDGVESSDLEERRAPHSEIAPGDVLGDAIVEHHMIRCARGARDALREPAVVVQARRSALRRPRHPR